MTTNLYETAIATAERIGQLKAETRIVKEIINDAVISTTVPVHVLERIVAIIENPSEQDEQPNTL